MNKVEARKRRAKKPRAIIRATKSQRMRIVVTRSNANIFAQIIKTNSTGDLVIVSASTLDKELKPVLQGNKKDRAYQVGFLLAKRAKDNNIDSVAFDRAGRKYHGRVKSLADGAREGGLNF